MEQEEPTMEEILASIRQILSGEENAPSPEKTEEPIVLDTPTKEEPLHIPPPPVFEPKEKEIPPIVAEPAPDAETQRITFTAPTNDNIITLTPEMLVVPEEVFEKKEEVIEVKWASLDEILRMSENGQFVDYDVNLLAYCFSSLRTNPQ